MSTATTEYDPYALSSGLVDDFDGEITSAHFATDAAYNDGQTVLAIFEIGTDNPDTPLVTEKLSVGTGWEIVDGGARIQSENGKPRNFNKQSRMGLFLAACVEVGALDAIRAKGDPFTAATFEGLTFHWLRKKIVGFNGEEKEVLLPATFAGTVTPGSSSVTPGNTPPASTSSGVDAKLTAKLRAAAKKAADHSEFIDLAFAIDGVTGNADAEALVVDETSYLELKG